MLDETTLTADLAPLRAALRGSLIPPGDSAYGGARQVFQAGVDRRPLAVARAAGVDDVVATVRFARERSLPLAVRAGGHSFAADGVVDDGLVLDLAALDAVDLDPASRTAWAGGGVRAGAYTAAAAEHDLATGFGDTGTVGVAGLTLGGGIGWLVRRDGLTIDSLLAAEVVTADGEVLIAEEEQHPDLFWALRGGGGNFGVVTRLRFRMHELGAVLGGMVVLPARREVLTGLVRLAGEADDAVTMIIHAGKAPPAPFLPAEVHGRPIVMAMFMDARGAQDGAPTLAAIRSLAPPLAEDVRAMPYPDIFSLGGEGPERAVIAVRNGFADTLDDSAADLILDRLATAPTPMAITQIRVLGGAVARVAPDATAFAHRDRAMLVITAAAAGDPDALPAADDWATARHPRSACSTTARTSTTSAMTPRRRCVAPTRTRRSRGRGR